MNDQEKAFVEIARTALVNARDSISQRALQSPPDISDSLQARVDRLNLLLESFTDLDA